MSWAKSGVALAAIALAVVAAASWIGDDSRAGSHERVERLRPSPGKAFTDRPTVLRRDGCYLGLNKTRQPTCAYGDRTADTTVVLFGDSHAEPLFDGINRLAKRREWRLVVLLKSFCSVAQIRQVHPYRDRPFHDCHRWRRETIQRIRHEERPDLVIVDSSAHADPAVGGREVSGAKARRLLAKGFASTLDRFSGVGEAALVTDLPKAPFKVPECIKDNRNRLRACDFRAPRGGPRALARRAIRRADDASVVNTLDRVCGPRRCHAVVDNVIVYRDTGHMTATFGRGLTRLFARELPPVG